MVNFVLEKLEEVKDGKLFFCKLIVDGKCFYDEFCQEVEKNISHKKDLNKIRTCMNILAENDLRLPDTKFNSIKEKNKVMGYEFKSGSLRVYVLKENLNVYIVLGGYKTNQKRDINNFQKIASQFREYVK